ncbi:MAG: hypothetical protein ACLTIG_07185 [Roseburia hominis]
MRIGELRALTLSDIDFDKNTIRINKTLPRGADETTTPKTLNKLPLCLHAGADHGGSEGVHGAYL